MLAEYVSVMLNRFKYLKHALMRVSKIYFDKESSGVPFGE